MKSKDYGSDDSDRCYYFCNVMAILKVDPMAFSQPGFMKKMGFLFILVFF